MIKNKLTNELFWIKYSKFSIFIVMNQQNLLTFLTIIETRNLNHAAQKLNVTQSTVSARLNSLEEELGQPLFHRRKSGAELTSAGFKFERYATLMTDLWRQAKQETALPSEVAVVCNLGCHPELWSGIAKEFFQQIRDKEPKAALSIWQGEQDSLTRWLNTGLIDVAICYSPTLHENWTANILHRERLLLVSSVRRKLMRWDPGYVYVDYGEQFRRAHATTYPDGDTPMTVFNSAQWALDYLLKNGGSAYLPERLIQNHLNKKNLHIVEKAKQFNRNIYLIFDTKTVTNWTWIEELINTKLAV